MTRWVVIAAVVVGGCSAPVAEPAGPFRGDESFSAEDRARIEQAEAWIAEQVGAAPFGVVWDLPHGEASDRSIVRARLPMSGGVWRDGSHIVLDADRMVPGSVYVAVVAAHEFGHVRGIQHHASVGVMTEGSLRETALEWSAADLSACAAAGVCR